MDFAAYIKPLLPSFSKDKLYESADSTRAGIQDTTLPIAQTACDVYNGQKFLDKESQHISSVILGTVKGKNCFEAIVKCLNNAVGIMDLAADFAKKNCNNTELKGGLTYAKVTVIRTINAAEFASTYTRKLINYILIREQMAADVGDVAMMSPKEEGWVRENLTAFSAALKILDRKPEDFANHLKNIPDAIVSEASEATFRQTIGGSKYDPMGTRFFDVDWSPIYMIRMAVADWQDTRYRSAQEERQLLQLRLMKLEQTRGRTQDAKLDKQIDHLQDRVTGLDATIAGMEKSWKKGTHDE
jgi:hypothetical protein